jgi:hypothetical protein
MIFLVPVSKSRNVVFILLFKLLGVKAEVTGD